MKPKPGFTLIEALAATALTAIMMTVVMSVISGIARNNQRFDTPIEHADWYSRLIESLQRDLRHADQFESEDNTVTIKGHASLDRKTLQPTHRPAVVTYHTEQFAGKSWLVRTQTDPFDPSLRNSWTQMVCSGVGGISVTPGTGSSGPSAPDPTEVPESSGESMPPITSTLTLRWSDPAAGSTSTTFLVN